MLNRVGGIKAQHSMEHSTMDRDKEYWKIGRNAAEDQWTSRLNDEIYREGISTWWWKCWDRPHARTSVKE